MSKLNRQILKRPNPYEYLTYKKMLCPNLLACKTQISGTVPVQKYRTNLYRYTEGACTVPLPGTVPNYGTVFCEYLELQKTANALQKNNVKNNASGGKHLNTLRSLNYAIAVSRSVSMHIKETS